MPLTLPSILEMQTKPRRQGHDLPVYTPRKVEEGEALRTAKGLRLVEIFDSIQGEGVNAGVPMTFVRFSKCNLACDFCDTPYERVAIEMSEDALLENLLARQPAWVLFTGGEPMLTLPQGLCSKLRNQGIKLTCESNGTVWNPAFEAMTHITISPKIWWDTPANPIPPEKVIHPTLAKAVVTGRITLHELRYIICGAADNIFALPQDVHQFAQTICLSPMIMDDDPNPHYVSGKGHSSPRGHVDPASFRRCMQLVSDYRRHNVRMSLQTHKFIGVR